MCPAPCLTKPQQALLASLPPPGTPPLLRLSRQATLPAGRPALPAQSTVVSQAGEDPRPLAPAGQAGIGRFKLGEGQRGSGGQRNARR